MYKRSSKQWPVLAGAEKTLVESGGFRCSDSLSNIEQISLSDLGQKYGQHTAATIENGQVEQKKQWLWTTTGNVGLPWNGVPKVRKRKFQMVGRSYTLLIVGEAL